MNWNATHQDTTADEFATPDSTQAFEAAYSLRLWKWKNGQSVHPVAKESGQSDEAP